MYSLPTNPSPPCLLPLNTPQHRIRQRRKYPTQVNPHIPASLPKLGRNRPHIPCLAHPRHAPRKIPRQQRQHRRHAQRKPARLVPSAEVIPFVPAEPFVLDEQDERKTDGPVAEQGDEVGDDGAEMVFARDGEDGDDERGRKGPDEAGHRMEIVAQELQAEAIGVVDGDVVAQHGEHEHHEAEFGPAEGVIGDEENAAETVGFVRGGVRIVCDAQGCVAETGADDRGKDGGDRNAEEGEGKDVARGRFSRVVAVVVCGDRAPPRR